MLFSLTCRGEGANDFSWLLHKRPERFQAYNLNFGSGYVFFPQNGAGLKTVCLLLDIEDDWLKRRYYEKSSEEKYVNDRMYISSSFLCTAIAQIFGSALKGVCESRPEAVERSLELEARIENFPCEINQSWLERIFLPLGYEFEWQSRLFDERFPEWGECRHGVLTLRGKNTLKNLLSQIYLLIPVFDRKIHYWLDDTQLDSFIRLGRDWIPSHPEAKYIIRWYFRRKKELGDRAAKALLEAQNPYFVDAHEEKLNYRRHEAIMGELLKRKIRKVIDLGCGSGNLLEMLRKSGAFSQLAGMDVSAENMAWARKRFFQEEYQGNSIELFTGSLTYRDERLNGYDAAILCEVIEHFDRDWIDKVMKNILGNAKPGLLIVTTPNHDFNINYALDDEVLRHPDHRFEFSRVDFEDWCKKMAASHGYEIEFSAVGDPDDKGSMPTLMGFFTKCA